MNVSPQDLELIAALLQRPNDPQANELASRYLGALLKLDIKGVMEAQLALDFHNTRRQDPDKPIGTVVDILSHRWKRSPSTIRRYVAKYSESGRS